MNQLCNKNEVVKWFGMQITSLAAAAEEHKPSSDEVERVRRAGSRRGAPHGDAARGQGA